MAWYHRIANVLRPGRMQRELDRELAFHIAERAEELQAAGMSEADAWRTARRQFGNYTAQVESTRDMDTNAWFDACARNLRHAVRALRKAPAFTATVVVTLALGIGANSAVFSAIYAVLLRPLPFPERRPPRHRRADQSQDRRQIRRAHPARRVEPPQHHLPGDRRLLHPGRFRTLRRAPRKTQARPRLPPLPFAPGASHPSSAATSRPQEEKFGGPNAVLISDRLWRRRFAADPHVLGKTLRFGRSSSPIIGVLPPSFLIPDRDVDLWCVSAPDAPYAQSRESTWFNAFGRLKPGVTVEQARANLAAVQASLGRQFPKTDAELSAAIEPLKESTVGEISRSLWILYGSVSLLLLIACANVAALLLSRAAARRHEISVRFSLGASRASVAAQLLTEVLVLALAGSALGLLLAAGSRARLPHSRQRPAARRRNRARLAHRALLSCLRLAATLLCGLAPRHPRHAPQSGRIARAGRAAPRSPDATRLQFALVAVQVAFAVTLLAGAGLLLRSFQELGRVSPGFDAERVLTFHVSSSWGETTDNKAILRVSNRILDGVRALPGVEQAATSLTLPGVPTLYQIELRRPWKAAPKASRTCRRRAAWSRPRTSPPCGFPCSPASSAATISHANTMMVNRSFANAYLSGAAAHRPPPGAARQRLRAAQPHHRHRRRRARNRHGSRTRPTVYWCFGATQPGTFFLVRTKGDPTAMAETVRRKVHELEPARSVYGLTPLARASLRRLRRQSPAHHSARLLRRHRGLARLPRTLRNAQLPGQRAPPRGRPAPRPRRAAHPDRRPVPARRDCASRCSAAWRDWRSPPLRTRLLAGMLFGVSASDSLTLAGVVAIVLAVSVAGQPDPRTPRLPRRTHASSARKE